MEMHCEHIGGDMGPIGSVLGSNWALNGRLQITLRPIRAQDLGLEIAFVNSLSQQTRYDRLMSLRKLSHAELVRMTDLDLARELALIATVCVDGTEQQIGVARCVRLGDNGTQGEMAIVIGDAWQGLGLGEKLLRALIDAAAEAGVRLMTGTTLSTNHRLIALARKLGFKPQRVPGDATVMNVSKALGKFAALPLM